MSEWQPIETAPKDGTRVKVRLGKWAPYHAYYKDGAWQPIEFNCPRNPNLWLPEPPK